MYLGIIKFLTYLSPRMIINIRTFFKGVQVHFAIYGYWRNFPGLRIDFHDAAIAYNKYAFTIFSYIHTGRTAIEFSEKLRFPCSWICYPKVIPFFHTGHEV